MKGEIRGSGCLHPWLMCTSTELCAMLSLHLLSNPSTFPILPHFLISLVWGNFKGVWGEKCEIGRLTTNNLQQKTFF